MANLYNFDFNLLRVLDALLIEHSTVKAGERLGLSQPAVSGALGRLRASLGDELFFRNGQKLEATEYALSLQEPVQDIMSRVEALISAPGRFDPSHSDHQFRVSGSDFFAELLMPALADRLAEVAASMRVHLVNLVPDDRVGALERYEVDFALLPQTLLPDWAEAEPVFRSSFSVIARKNHPRISENGIEAGDVIPLDLFCDLGHVLFSTQGTPYGFGDAALTRTGRERKVVMTLPVFSEVYRAVAGSNLIALLPTALAQRIAETSGLSIFQPPVPIDPVQLTVVWHRRFSKSPHHLWLKSQIHELLGQYDSGP